MIDYIFCYLLVVVFVVVIELEVKIVFEYFK